MKCLSATALSSYRWNEFIGHQLGLLDMTYVVKSADLSAGLTLPYVEQGDESGVPVILLHGVTDSWHSFELLLPHLPTSIHAFALTQRGHGDASRPASGYRYADLAEDVAAFMDAHHLDKAVLAGHSMGSSVAQRFALDHPERTAGLVLIASFLTLRGNATVQEFWDSTISTLTDPIESVIAREFQQSTIARPVPREFFETAVRESLKVPADVWKALFGGFLEEDFSHRLSEIKRPALIVWGDQDTFAPRSDQEALRAAISDSKLLIYPGTGHAVHWEQPERFAADLAEFVGSISGDQDPGRV
jgi:pimeloyl-ACP methyl ester carboxylesterase